MFRAPRCSGAVRIVSAASTGEVLRTARAGTPARASAPVISRGESRADRMPSPVPPVAGPAGGGPAGGSRRAVLAPGRAADGGRPGRGAAAGGNGAGGGVFTGGDGSR